MIKIAVSACLMGSNVRYDGNNKAIELNTYFDPDIYELTGICPEVEMGLSVPRPPIEIINNGTIKLLQVDDHTVDLTNQMKSWFQTNYQTISQYSGFILKSKSPSCGHQTTPHYDSNRDFHLGDGYFVNQLKSHLNKILLIEEVDLNCSIKLKKFIKSLTHKTPNHIY